VATSEWQISDSTTEIRRLTHVLLVYIGRRIPPHEDPRDYVSRIWLAAGKGFRHESSLHHYLFQIARRMISDRWRRPKPTPELVDLMDALPIDGPGCDTALDLIRSRASIDEAVPLVDPIYRDAVRMWLEGRDAMQIADRLGVRYNTARSRIVRGRQQLLDVLGPFMRR
jgi:RNA polymerase sigma factor (sigma-70 family)